MDKIVLGVPAYGTQPKDWWTPLIMQASELYKSKIQLEKIIAVGSMMTDVNRNHIVDEFLLTKSDWMFWVDADNVIPINAIPRMLKTGRSLITGVYVKREGEATPLLYLRLPNGAYDFLRHYTPGEIVAVDAAGMGGCLMHRDVVMAIHDNYRLFQRDSGGITLVHKDDIIGDVLDGSATNEDGKLINGLYHDRLRMVQPNTVFPYFMLEYGRTEDYGFFERAKRVHHPLWADTSVEIGHIGTVTRKVSEWNPNES